VQLKGAPGLLKMQGRRGMVAAIPTMQSQVWRVTPVTYKTLGSEDAPASQEEILKAGLMVEAGPLLRWYGKNGRGERQQFARISRKVLQLSTHHNPLAAKLATTLCTSRREWGVMGEKNYRRLKVGTLLGRLIPAPVLEKAKADRRKSHQLRSQWKKALVTTAKEFSFRFFPCLQTYPMEQWPTELRVDLSEDRLSAWRDASRGRTKMELLLRGYLDVIWPEELLDQPEKPQDARQLLSGVKPTAYKLQAASQAAVSGPQLKSGRLWLKLSQTDAARILQTSSPTLSRLERAKPGEPGAIDPRRSRLWEERYLIWCQRHRLGALRHLKEILANEV